MKKITLLLFLLATAFGHSQNIALGGTATASTENSNTAAMAIDGDGGTRWESAQSDPQWISIDLGTSYSINRVVLNWEGAYGQAYEIQISDDPTFSTSTTIFTTTSGDGGIYDLTVAGTGRYVRMYGTVRGTVYGYSLYEFEIYEALAPEADASLSDLKVDGVSIPGFSSIVTSYDYELAYGTTTVPTVTVTTTEAGATPVITPASGIPGSTTVTVTSQDTSTQLIYTVSFVANLPAGGAPVPGHLQGDVASIYSDSYTDPAVIDYNPWWWQSTSFSEEVFGGNNTIKHGNLNYQGINFDSNTIDASSMDYLHFDYWTTDGSQYRVSPISASTGEIAYIIASATQNEWVGVDVPLSYFTGVDAGFSLADIKEFKFDTETFDGNGQGAGNASQGFSIATFYVDNIYFYSGAPLSIVDFQIEDLKLYPNPTNNTWRISTKNQVINSIEVFNILGKRVLALKPNAISAEVDATGLASGIYITKISTESGTISKKLIKH